MFISDWNPMDQTEILMLGNMGMKKNGEWLVKYEAQKNGMKVTGTFF